MTEAELRDAYANKTKLIWTDPLTETEWEVTEIITALEEDTYENIEDWSMVPIYITFDNANQEGVSYIADLRIA